MREKTLAYYFLPTEYFACQGEIGMPVYSKSNRKCAVSALLDFPTAYSCCRVESTKQALKCALLYCA